MRSLRFACYSNVGYRAFSRVRESEKEREREREREKQTHIPYPLTTANPQGDTFQMFPRFCVKNLGIEVEWG